MTNAPYMPQVEDKELMDILEESFQSMETWCTVFQPDKYWKPFSSGHKAMFKLLDSDAQFIAIAAPRGFGKTTIFDESYPAREIAFRNCHYFVPISATGDSAVEFAENLRYELLTNEMIVDTFGPIRTKESMRLGEDLTTAGSFSSVQWVTESGIKVVPRGLGQQIRGKKHRGNRVDRVVGDDMEDEKRVQSEQLRHEDLVWFKGSVMNSVEKSRKDWRIIVIGTILHEDSLLSKLLNKKLFPQVHGVRLEICGDDYKSLWSDHMSDQQIMEEVEAARASGTLDVWYREYRNLAISTENRAFPPECFRYYGISSKAQKKITDLELNRNPAIVTVVLSDPARTMSDKSCKTAVSVVSVNIDTGEFFLRDYTEAHMLPPDCYNCMLTMGNTYNALVMAPETTGLHEYITYPLNVAMSESGKYYKLVEVMPREGKTGPKRSAGLVPFFRTGKFYINESLGGRVEKLLMQWPRPESWDLIDSIAGIIYVMENAEEYFLPLEPDKYEEADYEVVEYEPPLRARSII